MKRLPEAILSLDIAKWSFSNTVNPSLFLHSNFFIKEKLVLLDNVVILKTACMERHVQGLILGFCPFSWVRGVALTARRAGHCWHSPGVSFSHVVSDSPCLLPVLSDMGPLIVHRLPVFEEIPRPDAPRVAADEKSDALSYTPVSSSNGKCHSDTRVEALGVFVGLSWLLCLSGHILITSY